MSKKKGLKRGSAQYADYTKRLIHKKMEEDELTRHIARQMAMDAASLVLHDTFGYGYVRLKRFHDAWEEKINEIADLINEDYKDDELFEYSKAKIDEALKRCCGKEFVPWDERYSVR